MTGYAAAGYYSSCGNSQSQAMLTSPQSVAPYMPGFAFPPGYTPNSLATGSPSTSISDSIAAGVPTTLATSPGYFPSFNTTAIKAPFPLSSYMAMGINHSGSSPYSAATTPAYPPNVIATPVTQK